MLAFVLLRILKLYYLLFFRIDVVAGAVAVAVVFVWIKTGINFVPVFSIEKALKELSKFNFINQN